MQDLFEDALHGRAEQYRSWLDPVPVPAKAPVTAVELYDARSATAWAGRASA